MHLRQFVSEHGWWIPEHRFPYSLPINPSLGSYNLEQGEWFPYCPFLTYTKVVHDEILGVNALIRGADLLSEFSLYQHFRAQLGLEEIVHYYMPRLYKPDEGIISKFNGARSVLEYRDAGWKPNGLIMALAKSALREYNVGWELTNVKRNPRLVKGLVT